MQKPLVRVGEWLVSPDVNQISRNGRRITLEPRLIDLLVFLAHHPGEVLTRDELIDNVWKRNIVTSHVVTQSISELRKSLKNGDDDENNEYIVTIPKRGYKLTAPVTWCTEEGESTAFLSPEQPDIVSDTPLPTDAPSITAPRLSDNQPRKYRHFRVFIVWTIFLLAVFCCVFMVAKTVIKSNLTTTNTQLLLNPLDIDIHLVNGNACNNWNSQLFYAVGLGSLVTSTLNTYSNYMVHDKINYSGHVSGNSGKTLTLEFLNQRHYRAQQCFMSVRLVDHANGEVMLDKRYFITGSNEVAIQNDLLSNLSSALSLSWSDKMTEMMSHYQPIKSQSLAHFFEAHQLLMQGDAASLNKASEILEDVAKQSPEFTYVNAEKALIDIFRHTQQLLDDKQLKTLYASMEKIRNSPGIKDSAIYYQIKTVDLLDRGNVEEAYQAINLGIRNELSWLNYILLGKVYEMKGENRLAADAYITAFNLRPGENTLYWIKNGIFQTSLNRIVPYLENYSSAE
ncbi:lysine decarboxylation/transport transcriptional activator CadC [Escherichia marmotae]|uniref:lysine decarboxylation/transport transcriptional activator CadC n=1 Tax=Escherichia marmotae TaxID=1499973 RepID=UPI003CEF24DC